MSVTVDPRLGARRRIVREDGARRRLRRVLAALVVAAVAGLVVWFVNSPFMAIESIDVIGADRSTPDAGLDALGIAPGEPIIWVRPSRVEDALRQDPWVKDVRVQLQYPHGVTITVLEHEPLVWTQADSAWALLSVDGIVLTRASAVPDGDPVAMTGNTMVDPGRAVSDPNLLAALTFISQLPADLRLAAQVRLEDDGLWATIGGFHVELGKPAEMLEKAAVTVAIINQGVGNALSLDVTAPSRPALVMPTAEPADDQTSEQAEGVVEGEDLDG